MGAIHYVAGEVAYRCPVPPVTMTANLTRGPRFVPTFFIGTPEHTSWCGS